MSNKTFLSLFAVLSLIAFGSGYWMESQALKKVRRVIEEPPFVKKGLLAYFPLNGRATDASGKGNHGNLQGPPRFVDDRFGVAQAACLFDGVNDRVTFDKNKTMEIQNPNNFTVSFWIKKEDTLNGTVMQLFGDGEGPPVDGYLEVGQGGKTIFMQWIIRSRGGRDELGSMEAILDSANGGWNFIAIVFKEKEKDDEPKPLLATIYINGEKPAGSAGSDSSSLFTATEKMKKVFILGRQSISGSQPFRGGLDDVRIYLRSLSELEIENLYKYEKYRE